MAQINNVILVHGAWADGSAWIKVLPLIINKGFSVNSIQLPLTSLVEDVAALRRGLALIDGPALLVGHSYGGAVITEGGDDPKVAGLVFIDAFAPDADESAGSLGAGGPPTSLPDNLVPDAQGFLKLTAKGVEVSFAHDLTPAEQALILATQGPVSGPAALGAAITAPAWKVKPCWYLLGTNDAAIHPDLQAMMAKRMEAITVTCLSLTTTPILRHHRRTSVTKSTKTGSTLR